MKAIHGGKAKNDRIDPLEIATLLRGDMLPQTYVPPLGKRIAHPYRFAYPPRTGERSVVGHLGDLPLAKCANDVLEDSIRRAHSRLRPHDIRLGGALLNAPSRDSGH
jgi:hypothetical protein